MHQNLFILKPYSYHTDHSIKKIKIFTRFISLCHAPIPENTQLHGGSSGTSHVARPFFLLHMGGEKGLAIRDYRVVEDLVISASLHALFNWLDGDKGTLLLPETGRAF